MIDLTDSKEKILNVTMTHSTVTYKNLKLKSCVTEESVKVGKLCRVMVEGGFNSVGKECVVPFLGFESAQHIPLSRVQEILKIFPAYDVQKALFEQGKKDIKNQVNEATQKMFEQGCKKVIRVFIGTPYKVNADGEYGIDECVGIVLCQKVAILGD